MAFEQVRDLLKYIEKFHHRLGEYYQNMEESLPDREKLRLLYEYLSEHELRMERNLAAFEQEASAAILDTWFKYTPKRELGGLFAQLTMHPCMSVDEVINSVLQLDEHLLDLYHEIHEMTRSKEVKEVFANLYETGKQDRHQLFQALAQFKRDYDARKSEKRVPL
jgi:regulator of replication initiation timing